MMTMLLLQLQMSTLSRDRVLRPTYRQMAALLRQQRLRHYDATPLNYDHQEPSNKDGVSLNTADVGIAFHSLEQEAMNRLLNAH